MLKPAAEHTVAIADPLAQVSPAPVEVPIPVQVQPQPVSTPKKVVLVREPKQRESAIAADTMPISKAPGIACVAGIVLAVLAC